MLNQYMKCGDIEGIIVRENDVNDTIIIRDHTYIEHDVSKKDCIALNKFKKNMHGQTESQYSKVIINELLKKFNVLDFNDILCDYEEIKNQINCLHNEIANGGVTEISFQWVLTDIERGFTYLRTNESLDELISYSGGINSIDGCAEIKVNYYKSIEITFNGGEFK